MDESPFTKLRITKVVNDGMKDVLARTRSNASISQFAEELLLEACESILANSLPTLMPTVVKLRMRLGLSITGEMNPLLERAPDSSGSICSAETPPGKKPPRKVG